MSFFGLETTLSRDQPHSTKAPGFALVADPFASLSRTQALETDNDDAYVNPGALKMAYQLTSHPGLTLKTPTMDWAINLKKQTMT